MTTLSKALQTVADDLNTICQNNKTCDTCPFYKKGRDCSPNTMDELVRNAKKLEERCQTILEGVQALASTVGVK